MNVKDLIIETSSQLASCRRIECCNPIQTSHKRTSDIFLDSLLALFVFCFVFFFFASLLSSIFFTAFVHFMVVYQT